MSLKYPSALERRRNTSKGSKDVYLKAKARIYESGLDCLTCAMFARQIIVAYVSKTTVLLSNLPTYKFNSDLNQNGQLMKNTTQN